MESSVRESNIQTRVDYTESDIDFPASSFETDIAQTEDKSNESSVVEKGIHDMSLDELEVDDSVDQSESCIETDVEEFSAENINGEEVPVPFIDALVENTLPRNLNDSLNQFGENSCMETDVKDFPSEETNGEQVPVHVIEALGDTELERYEKRDEYRRDMSEEMGAKESKDGQYTEDLNDSLNQFMETDVEKFSTENINGEEVSVPFIDALVENTLPQNLKDSLNQFGENSCMETDVKDFPAEETNGEEVPVHVIEALGDT